ncbi:V-set and immunoglobulin domain-containing protein 10-like 2 [Pseudophryne corroboree]|uniref:V-set and immunoglobulin domain-containing protein 10-like 2 n=1 Tax=Pseudophryne corroboree TaxID=495146 RepID=UPI0030816222
MDYGLTRNCNLKKLLGVLCFLQALSFGRLQKNLHTINGVLDRSVVLPCGEIDTSYIFVWTVLLRGTVDFFPVARKDHVYVEAASLGSVSLRGTTLVIDQLQSGAEGQYTCIAFKEEPVITASTVYINLTVLVPVAKPSLQIDEQTPVEGMSVRMTCTVEFGTGPVTYVWQRYSRTEGTFTIQEGADQVLVLSPVTRFHTAFYFCTVRNVVNEETSGWLQLDVIYGPDVPVITIKPYAISENGFAANELEEVTLNCSASSNPPSFYTWYYNNSEMVSSQMYVIPKISRSQTGEYTCLAKNVYRNTGTKMSISLTVYYLPEGSPTCTALPRNNYRNVALWCSWVGGLPLAQLYWQLPSEEDIVIVSNSNATLVKSGTEIVNGTTYVCTISHPALKRDINCATKVVRPAGMPNCSAVATKLNEFIMLTCDWAGGLPRITLEWNNNEIGDLKESSNIYVFKPDRTYNGKLFTCTALHPMIPQPAECHIRLESPTLDSPSLETSILEGNSAQLICNLKQAIPSSEITWYDNLNKEIITDSQKYGILKEQGLSALTVRETSWNTDSGFYRCMASNAVGNTSVLIRLNVNKYPTPPNVTISKLLYSRQRTEVDVEWLTKGTGDLTGFMVQRQASVRSSRSIPVIKRSVRMVSWDTVANYIDPQIRGQKLGGLDPSIVYAFRILAVNHKTTGFPSEVKTPADPPDNVYPAAIGAGFAGMVVATVASLLVFQYIARNRERNPRLHDLFFRPAPEESRENIRNPEDAETAADNEEEATTSQDPSPAADAPAQDPVVPAAPGDSGVPLSQLSVADLPDDAPVNVTITVTATP